jgi:hypothetical protein
MILKYLNNSDATQEYIITNFVSTNHLLDSLGLFRKFNRSISTKPIPGGDSGYKQVVDFIKTNGKPFILCKKSLTHGQDATHFVVVKGLNADGKVVLNDPANNRVAFVDTVLQPSDLLDGTGKAKGSIRYYK